MRFLRWFLALGWYFLITLIAMTYWKTVGWWFLIVCVFGLFLGEHLINKMFGQAKKDGE